MTDAAAQSKDTTVVIPPEASWRNATAQTYFAIPDSSVRVILRDLLVKDALDSIYARDSKIVAELHERVDVAEQTLWRDRVIGGILILILILK